MQRKDPFDREYYWLTGKFINLDGLEKTDYGALEQGYVSITPVHHDLTAHDFMHSLEGWDGLGG